MYKIEKIKWEDRNKLYFSSDWHIFHDPQSWDVPIWKMRGYTSVEDAAIKIQNMINDTVPEDGIIYFLGDMFLNATDEKCIEWLKGVKCKDIRALWGNHESNTYRIYKEELFKVMGGNSGELYPANFERIPNLTFVGNHVEIQVGKRRIVMNHFPLKIWNGSNRSTIHLNGHSHLSDPERLPEFPLGKTLDVGIDCGKIWSFGDIEDVMSTKSVNILDHHDSTIR
jgi:calcineurin-like phosphoesterase family protein